MSAAADEMRWGDFDDHMFWCDQCAVTVEAVEAFRNSGDEGVHEVRKLLAERGWDCDEENDIDLCPDCCGFNATREQANG